MPLTGLPWDLFNWMELEFFGKLSFMKGGLTFADALNTVSKQYAREIQTEEYGAGLEGVLTQRRDVLFGVVNGVDYNVARFGSGPQGCLLGDGGTPYHRTLRRIATSL